MYMYIHVPKMYMYVHVPKMYENDYGPVYPIRSAFQQVQPRSQMYMSGLHLGGGGGGGGGGAGGHWPPLCSLLPPQIFFRLYM